MTNVLSNDPLYRRVARLYLAWQRATPEPTEEERRVEEEAAADGFHRFCLLVLLRALDQLGHTPTGEQRVVEGAALRFGGPAGPVTLQWRRDGPTLAREGRASLRLVTLPIALLSTPAGETGGLSSVLAGLGDDTLVLHLGPAQPPALPPKIQAQLLGLSGPKLAPVSPWDLGSVERVARVLRGFLLTPEFLAYPPEVHAVPKGLSDLLQGRTWLRWGGNAHELVLPPNGSHERRRTDERYQELRAELEAARTAETTAREARENSKHDRRALGQANQDKTQATQRVRKLEAAAQRYHEFLESLRRAEEVLERLRRCPVCGKAGQRLENHGDDFQCRCADCDSVFGTRRCACGRRFATVWPASAWPPPEGSTTTENWVDRLVGCDVLTQPCPVNHGDGPRFSCPACNNCPGCE